MKLYYQVFNKEYNVFWANILEYLFIYFFFFPRRKYCDTYKVEIEALVMFSLLIYCYAEVAACYEVSSAESVETERSLCSNFEANLNWLDRRRSVPKYPFSFVSCPASLLRWWRGVSVVFRGQCEIKHVNLRNEESTRISLESENCNATSFFGKVFQTLGSIHFY